MTTVETHPSPLPPYLFQGPDEPFPRHWAVEAGGLSTDIDERLRTRVFPELIAGLPPLWREVVQRHDGQLIGLPDVAAQLRLTAEQAREILNAARAQLWLGLSEASGDVHTDHGTTS